MPSNKIVTISYSQSGQLDRILDRICAPLETAGFDIIRVQIRPQEPAPFPWPLIQFFNSMPETVHDVPQPIELVADEELETAFADTDLVILAYQVWFLAPSRPVTSFLQSEAAHRLLSGRRVMTVIGCRNMWLMAQERMKGHLARLGARLVDNVAFTDPGHSGLTFFSTPIWVLTGQRGPWLRGLIARAGVPDEEIEGAARFGTRIAAELPLRGPADDRPLLTGLGAVTVHDRFLASERAGTRSFAIWGRFFLFLGAPDAVLRKAGVVIFILFLLCLIVTVVPITTLVGALLGPFTKSRRAQIRAFFAQPSGEQHDLTT